MKIHKLEQQLQQEQEAYDRGFQEGKKQIEPTPAEEGFQDTMDLENLEEFLTDEEEGENEEKNGSQTQGPE